MRATTLFLTAALALSLAVACGGGSGGGDDDGLPTVIITGDDGARAELQVELARTAEEHQRGLMSRQQLPEDVGMLFAFPQDTGTAFWMKDTVIPLSIAFVTADGTILDIQDMEPLSETLHQAPQPFRYALEVNQGWFQRHRIVAGDRLEIPESASAVSPDE